MFLGRVTGNQIQQYPHIPFVGFVKKPEQVFVAAVTGGDFFVVPHIVAGIPERRIKTGIDPQGVAPQPFNIIEFFDYPRNVANAVPV